MDGLSDEEKKNMKFGIMKNVIIISIAFMLLFTAFQSMAQLQSSLNEVNPNSGEIGTRAESAETWVEGKLNKAFLHSLPNFCHI